MANANQVIVNGETILDLRSDTVTPETLQKGYTAHDKSGTKITGTLEAASSGGAKETWVLYSVLNKLPDVDDGNVIFNADFTSDGLSFSSITITANIRQQILYNSTAVRVYEHWVSEAYRKLTFATPPTGDLLTWLQANGVKQPANLAVQPSKDVTVTSNGTTEITPDAPYDVMEKANLTVNVPTSGTQLSCVTDLGLLTFGRMVNVTTKNGTQHEYVQYTSNAFSVPASLASFPGEFRYSICVPFYFPWHSSVASMDFFESGFLYIWFTTDLATGEISTTGAITMGANIFTLMDDSSGEIFNCVKLISLDDEGTSYQIRFTLSTHDTKDLGILAPPNLVSGEHYLTTHLENVRGLLITYEEETE